MNNELQLSNQSNDLAPLSASDVVAQVNLIQEIMRATMKDGEHYGKIPGCGDKPSLLQPGAQKLLLTFRLNPEFDVQVIDLPGGHREYRSKCRLTNVRGEFVGSGDGSCSTMESKYRYRTGPKEFTGKPVPVDYWKLRKTEPGKAQEAIGGKGFIVGKNDAGIWEICIQGEKVEHDNPADYYNTALKISNKRSLVGTVLMRTGASDIFTQDLEDIPIPQAASGAATSATRAPIKQPSPLSRSKPLEPTLPESKAAATWSESETASEQSGPSKTIQQQLAETLADGGVCFDDTRTFLQTKAFIQDASSIGSFDELPTDVCLKLCKEPKIFAELVKKFGKAQKV